MKMIQEIRNWYSGRRLAAGLAAAIGTATIGPSVAQANGPESPVVHGAAEVIVGQESGTLDTKILVFDGDLTLFSRDRITETHEDSSIDVYSVSSIAYALGSGVDFFVEVDAAPGVGLMPRAGIQHFYAGDGFTLFDLLSVPVDGSFDLLHIGQVTYGTPLSEDLGLATSAETLTSFSEEGLDFATQRLRLGLDLSGYQIGTAVDLTETTDEIGANVGGYVGTTF